MKKQNTLTPRQRAARAWLHAQRQAQAALIAMHQARERWEQADAAQADAQRALWEACECQIAAVKTAGYLVMIDAHLTRAYRLKELGIE